MPPQLSKAKQYTQKYRSEWKADKKYEAWLGPVAGNDAQAHCSFCNKSFVAKIQNVKNHYETEIHKRHERDRGLTGRSADIMERFAAAGATAAQVQQQKETDLQLATFLVKHSTFEAASHLAPIVGNNGTVTKWHVCHVHFIPDPSPPSPSPSTQEYGSQRYHHSSKQRLKSHLWIFSTMEIRNKHPRKFLQMHSVSFLE